MVIKKLETDLNNLRRQQFSSEDSKDASKSTNIDENQIIEEKVKQIVDKTQKQY